MNGMGGGTNRGEDSAAEVRESLIVGLQTHAREAACDSDRAIQAEVYACPYCEHLLAFVSEVEWPDWRKEPHDGTWGCPNCRRAQCSLCNREAKTHRWGYDSGGAPDSAQYTFRADLLLCSQHEGGYKRRIYDRPLRNVEPLAAWFDRAVWTSPLYLHKHAAYLAAHCSGSRRAFALGADPPCQCGKFANLRALHAAQDWDDEHDRGSVAEGTRRSRLVEKVLRQQRSEQ